MPMELRRRKAQVPTDASGSSTKHKDAVFEEYEFGGPWGSAFIIVLSHFLMYYFWISVEFYNGALIGPESWSADGVSTWTSKMWGHFLDKGVPNRLTFLLYTTFLLYEFLLALVMPGVVVKGLKIPVERNRQITYYCNAYSCWLVLLATIGILHYLQVLPLQIWRENFGSLMTVSVIFGNFFSVAIFISGHFSEFEPVRMSNNIVYDFFMGSFLNPQLSTVDLKMFAEIRNSWCLLFLLTCSCAAEMYKTEGTVTYSMTFLIIAHFLYVNACQKGEECIPTTWDIYYEKWGWMIIFWNFAGVPFLYCIQSLYVQTVLKAGWDLSPAQFGVMLCILFFAYYVFDTANSQKNHFRMRRQNGVIIERSTFPQLPWRTIDNPRVVGKGNLLLLADGWWGVLRKPHYTADLTMSLSWGLACGFGSFVPYFYFFFFLTHLTHRVWRDQVKCAKKYEAIWDEYCRTVPYIFIPKVF